MKRIERQVGSTLFSSLFVLALVMSLVGTAKAAVYWGDGTPIGRANLDGTEAQFEFMDYVPFALFCKRETVRDYTRSFRRMSPARGLPVAGRLPFAPREMQVSKPSNAILVIGGSLGLVYGLDVPSGVSLNRRLKWQVKSQLVEVNARGRRLRVVGHQGFRLSTSDPAVVGEQEVSFGLPPKVAFYRVEISFERLDGSILGRYKEYFRIVEPSLHTKLEAARGTVKVGESLAFRVENRGTQSVAFGEEFQVESKSEGRWSRVALPLGPWLMPRRGLGPGEAGTCQFLAITNELAAGVYRVVKELLRPEGRRISDEFTVSL